MRSPEQGRALMNNLPTYVFLGVSILLFFTSVVQNRSSSKNMLLAKQYRDENKEILEAVKSFYQKAEKAEVIAKDFMSKNSHKVYSPPDFR